MVLPIPPRGVAAEHTDQIGLHFFSRTSEFFATHQIRTPEIDLGFDIGFRQSVIWSDRLPLSPPFCHEKDLSTKGSTS